MIEDNALSGTSEKEAGKFSSFLPSGTKLGSLVIDELLFYYDGPKLFIARNTEGELFLATCINESEKGFSWLYVKISVSRLDELHASLIDLRDAYLKAESEVWQVFTSFARDGRDSAIIREKDSLLDSELSMPGYFLTGAKK